jgi:predicted nucleic acid-binding protein
MSDRVFLDTNVLVYLFDGSEPKKRERAQARLSTERRKSELVISTQVMLELYNALTRGPHPICQHEDASAAVREAGKLTVVQVDPPLILEAIAARREEQLSLWDALIIQAARVSGCARVLSEDLCDGRTYGAVLIENPFAGL